MRVLRSKRVPGGYEVLVVNERVKPGRNREPQPFRVFVPAEPDATPDELRAALLDSLRDPFRQLRGVDITAAPETRDAIEAILPKRWERWQMWKTTREEATLRMLPAGVITALTNREDAAWSAYLQALNRGRNAT